MLFAGKKCHNSGHRPVVSGIVASFCFFFIFFIFSHFISNTFRIILSVPSKQGFCNASIVKSKSNFSIHFSKCFFTVPNAPITTGITLPFSFSKFLQFDAFCFFLFNASVKWACGIYQ